MKSKTGGFLVIFGTVALAVGLMGVAIPSAHAAGGQSGVCPSGGAWSAKIDMPEPNPTSVTVPNASLSLPAGKLIAEYCVKGGSPNSGGGKYFVTVDPPASSVTITMPAASRIRTISHYSVRFVDGPDESTTTTTEPEDTTTTTTQPEETTTTQPEETSTTQPEETSTTQPEETTTTAVAIGGPTTTTGAPASGGSLPSTGSDSAPYLLALGTVLLVTGGAMMALRRRTT
jgi:LPXTG-motif cell wall-anchored protein